MVTGCGVSVSNDLILPDFIDSGQRMHHYHLLLGYSHDVWGEDELAKTLRKKKKQSRLIHGQKQVSCS